jgi:hypothetical protein
VTLLKEFDTSKIHGSFRDVLDFSFVISSLVSNLLFNKFDTTVDNDSIRCNIRMIMTTSVIRDLRLRAACDAFATRRRWIKDIKFKTVIARRKMTSSTMYKNRSLLSGIIQMIYVIMAPYTMLIIKPVTDKARISLFVSKMRLLRGKTNIVYRTDASNTTFRFENIFTEYKIKSDIIPCCVCLHIPG